MATFRIAVKTEIDHSYVPSFFCEKPMEDALTAILGMTPSTLAYRLDGHFASGIPQKAGKSSNDRKSKLKAEIRKKLCERLCV